MCGGALPDGTEQERTEFRRYWRERLDRERDHQDREREHSDREAERRLILRSNAIAAAEKGLAQPLVRDALALGQEEGVAAIPKTKVRGRKRGPKPDHEGAARVAEIVARAAPDGDWRSKVDDICEALDKAQVPFPPRWRKRDRSCDGWAAYDERANAVKAIEYRLKVARQRKKTTPETPS